MEDKEFEQFKMDNPDEFSPTSQEKSSGLIKSEQHRGKNSIVGIIIAVMLGIIAIKFAVWIFKLAFAITSILLGFALKAIGVGIGIASIIALAYFIWKFVKKDL